MGADRPVDPRTLAGQAAIRARFEQAFAHHRAGRDEAAFRGYDAVLAVDPLYAPALHFSALLLHGAGRSDAAILRIERSLAIDGGVPDAWSNAGSLYTAVGRAADAARALDRALQLEPTLSEAWVNLAALRLACDDAAGAEAAARRALALSASPRAQYNLVLALAAQGRAADALAALETLEPSGEVGSDDTAVPALRAQLLIATGRRDAAGAVLEQALARGDDAALRIGRARLLDEAGRPAEALEDYGAALRIDPGQETALSEAVFLKKRLASWHGLGHLQGLFRERVARHAAAGDASALTPFSFLSDPSTRVEQRAAATAWSRRFPDHPACTREVSEGRLRIGYLSADFHAHATGVLAVGLFEQHDRDRFGIVGYSTGPDDGSALRARLVASVDRFVEARGWTDARLADAIRDDGVDILVDLKGHTEDAPTGVMARQPAPIAVSYLGYPGTMGAPFIDYLIGDPVVTPLDHADDYDETLVLLPHSYQPTDDRRAIGDSPSRHALGLPLDAVVFCGFGSVYKITPDVFGTWVEIVREVPGSVLWLLTRGDDHAIRDRLRREAVSRGLAADRLVFADTRPHVDYLALYRHADLFLDTWPYNAHTTASDALWVGCPLLTIVGDTFAGRVAASLLTAAGFTDGITTSRKAFVERAIAWGNDRPALAARRRHLEATVRSSALFDTRGHARDIERAYAAMAAQHATGRREPIVVSAVTGSR